MMKTKTAVHSFATQRRQRERSQAAAFRALAGVQMGAQLLLWITFFGYDRAAQAIWQAALLWLIPFVLLWFVWKAGAPALDTKPARYASIALLPCLIIDAAFVLFALSGFIGQLIPQYPGWVGVIVPVGFALAAAYLSRVRGVSYGADVLKGLLVLLFVFGTVFLRASTRADRLWPLLGKGVGPTAITALAGAGSLWGTALLFVLPGEERPRGKTIWWGLIVWAMGCLWALWYGFVRPWAAGDVLAVAEKMMGLARHASSVTLYEMAGLMWMILLPVALTGALSTGEKLMLNAFPKCPRIVPILSVLLPGSALLLIWPEKGLGILEAALPWRAVVSLAAGVFALVLARKGAKR